MLVTTLTKKMAEDLTDYLFEQGIKVRYLHSDIGTLERVEILRDLRTGVTDVVVGINLLREGLDLPEVSLVAILDADKEGFLRNFRSLIQTIGRAARNVSGQVIMYADRVTDSMRLAIDETDRRRALQIAYNDGARHRAADDPQGDRRHRAVRARRRGAAHERRRGRRELAKLPRAEALRLISSHGGGDGRGVRGARLRDGGAPARPGREAARRDRGAVEADDVLDRLKQGARKGSAYGKKRRR